MTARPRSAWVSGVLGLTLLAGGTPSLRAATPAQKCARAKAKASFGLGVATTVWDWLNQLNAYGFAGHHDWRLAKESGFNPGEHELETILLMPFPCTTGPLPCIDPIFGPTSPDTYWSATTKGPTGPTGPTRPSDGWFVDFLHGNYGDSGKWGPLYVRAVRSAQ